MQAPVAANDNQPTKARSLADLGALLAYRNRPDHKPEPVKSNWTVVKDEVSIDAETRHELFPEHRLEITPSIAEIVRSYSNDNGITTDYSKFVRNEHRQTIAIGGLRFSDGTQRERTDTIGPDGDVIQYDRRMPAGAMLGTTEKVGALSGGSDRPAVVELSNGEICRELGVSNRTYIPGRRKRRNREQIPPRN